jgi:hypothetical protein
MVKLIRFIGLVSQSIFLQFIHVFGLVAFLIAAAVGYYRVKSWVIPLLGVAFGVIANYYVDLADVTGILEKASAANERGGFLIVVYFIISFVGYLVGAYARHYQLRLRSQTATKG